MADIRFEIHAMPDGVVMNFGKAVAWIKLSPKEAREIAKNLIALADDVEHKRIWMP